MRATVAATACALTGALTLIAASPVAAATPITESSSAAPGFIGSPATTEPLFMPTVPQHPFLARNGSSNIHEDGYQTDVHSGSGPMGKNMERLSSFLEGVCGSVTFDSRDRLVTVCVGLEGPKLVMIDPRALDTVATMALPPRTPSLNIFNDFAGGGYFYLDNRDRAVIPTTSRHIFVVGTNASGFQLERDYDLNSVVASDDKIISALPDWSGRLWFLSVNGVVGTVDQGSGAVRVMRTGEAISNSFAVDEEGGVYVVTQKALYRFDADGAGAPQVTWREVYDNSGISKPGQVHAGSGTTPTVMSGTEYVSITDNADPMNVVVYRRGKRVGGDRKVCQVAVFEKGASASDNSLIGRRKALIVENNYGYSGPAAVFRGGLTSPGIERVDVNRRGTGCKKVWKSGEVSPTVVPKLSLGSGLVYAYTKTNDTNDPWYLTAIDFKTGKTAFKQKAGEGLGFNNNYAGLAIGPDGTAYLGVLGGIVALRDRPAPTTRQADRPALKLHLIRKKKRKRHRSATASGKRKRRGTQLRVVGADVGDVESVEFLYRRKRLGERQFEAPFSQKLKRKYLKRKRKRRLRAEVVMDDGQEVTLKRKAKKKKKRKKKKKKTR